MKYRQQLEMQPSDAETLLTTPEGEATWGNIHIHIYIYVNKKKKKDVCIYELMLNEMLMLKSMLT